ncbi:MAG: efflux RND transporter periplasmic adaptor subunit [Gammaproteobacteria bacterium]
MNHPLRGFLLLLIAGLTACGGDSGNGAAGGAPQGPPPADVNVAPVELTRVTEWDQFNGRIEAVHNVEIRPRVGGYLEQVHFAEGSVVEEGAVLYTIDPREYEAAVRRAEAGLAGAQARQKQALIEQARSEKLLEVQAVSNEEFEQRRGEALQARAQIATAEAELVQAELNLEFATIRAPITGRVGEALVRPGNLVSPGTTLLTTLVSIDPVHVVFEGDEHVYLKYQAQARRGDRPSSRDVRNPVRVGLINEEGFPHEGEMDFVDNQLNPATGTIRGRAVLANPDGIFTPGLFARLRLLGSSEYEALLVSELAVLTDQDRKYVYVVGPNGEAQRRDVQLGRDIDGLRVVEQGLREGDQVVVNGTSRIFFPGAPLKTTQVTMENPSGVTTPAP